MDLLGPSELLRAWAGRPGTLLIVPIRVVCQDRSFDLLASMPDEGGADACTGVFCGDGECAVVGGVAHCACDAGDVATVSSWGIVVCSAIESLPRADSVVWGSPPEQVWGSPPGLDDLPGPSCSGCGAAGAGSPGGLLLLPLLGWTVRRRT